MPEELLQDGLDRANLYHSGSQLVLCGPLRVPDVVTGGLRMLEEML